jgi:hypothetical protein
MTSERFLEGEAVWSEMLPDGNRSLMVHPTTGYFCPAATSAFLRQQEEKQRGFERT